MLTAAALFLLVCLSTPAEVRNEKGKTPATKSPAAKATRAKLEASHVPAGAVKVSPGQWRYVDEQGKVWMYRTSPFGLMRFEASPEDQTKVPEEERAASGIQAFDEGDTVRFERRTPMGVSRWQKRKSEMNEAERKAWQRDTGQKQSAGQPDTSPAAAPQE